MCIHNTYIYVDVVTHTHIHTNRLTYMCMCVYIYICQYVRCPNLQQRKHAAMLKRL